ncbi:hypothetical protein U0C82_08130 [Fulvimarina sp. 2208YS6-2-32]|uniref:Uncharacterized protein n=1 Tax=Fulvimarina uroteuthidis TaxID=3098149 RepID=A0ABU5I150_9HYPH|nr:hypothetical protein [Fulvimarina sp. 2208YS6-2-32]MDY8109112.1 hypothetical protein [Fulvimarina sp. 2208YS6-2-32]
MRLAVASNLDRLRVSIEKRLARRAAWRGERRDEEDFGEEIWASNLPSTSRFAEASAKSGSDQRDRLF